MPTIQPRTLSHNGRKLSVPAWAKFLGVPRSTIYQRLAAGMPIGKVLSTKELFLGPSRPDRYVKSAMKHKAARAAPKDRLGHALKAATKAPRQPAPPAKRPHAKKTPGKAADREREERKQRGVPAAAFAPMAAIDLYAFDANLGIREEPLPEVRGNVEAFRAVCRRLDELDRAIDMAIGERERIEAHLKTLLSPETAALVPAGDDLLR